MGRRTEFGDLQDEILVHIFHKLALKSVVQCKLVCKRWRSLITDPFFTSNYNPSSIPNHPMSFIMVPEAAGTTYSISLYELSIGQFFGDEAVRHRVPISWTEQAGRSYSCRPGIQVLGTCNGLVGLHDHKGSFCLLNSWTREEKRVRVAARDIELGRSFDLHGICHNPSRDEYKAVLSTSGSATFHVVSFKGAQGRCESRAQPAGLYSNRRRSFEGTVVRGIPHWISYFSGYGGRVEDTTVIYFDPVREEFGEVRGPEVEGVSALVGLGALDGQLTVAVRARPLGEWGVWALKEEGNSWTKLFVIPCFHCTISLWSWIAEDQVLVHDKSRLIMYNPKLDGSTDTRLVASMEVKELFGTNDLISKFYSQLG